jgi:hypothetical protein
LHEVALLNIENNTKGESTTIRESWHIEHCKQALEITSLYEAAGTLWWFDPLLRTVTWEGEPAIGSEVSAHMLDLSAAHWSKDKFIASSEIEK